LEKSVEVSEVPSDIEILTIPYYSSSSKALTLVLRAFWLVKNYHFVKFRLVFV